MSFNAGIRTSHIRANPLAENAPANTMPYRQALDFTVLYANIAGFLSWNVQPSMHISALHDQKIRWRIDAHWTNRRFACLPKNVQKTDSVKPWQCAPSTPAWPLRQFFSDACAVRTDRLPVLVERVLSERRRCFRCGLIRLGAITAGAGMVS
ncbi:MAG: hypothetical protein ABI476_05615 [Oxalobacteraceae bacterium]